MATVRVSVIYDVDTEVQEFKSAVSRILQKVGKPNSHDLGEVNHLAEWVKAHLEMAFNAGRKYETGPQK